MGLSFVDMGIISYRDAMERQARMTEKRINGEIGDTVILLEHYPVVTLGRNASMDHIRDIGFFKSRDIEFVHTDRGGGITYHSPGQLLIYPIVHIGLVGCDVSAFLDLLEDLVSEALRKCDVLSERVEGKRGVWAGGSKIAFTGLKFRRGISFHGIAVNVNNDIEPFGMMFPCGLRDVKISSASISSGRRITVNEIKSAFRKVFSAWLSSGCGTMPGAEILGSV